MNRPRIAINGFGRIGRTLLRVLLRRNDVEIVAINDVADSATMVHLFRYDSIHGKWELPVSFGSQMMSTSGQNIGMLSEADWSQLPWKQLGVDIVIECSGVAKSKEMLERHVLAGAHKVILSAPIDDVSVPMLVLGINDDVITPETRFLSCASCTTNSAAPMIRIIEDHCGIESCYITTVHSYTGDQRLHDAPHKDWRRGRAAAESIVPTSTGAAKALTHIFPELADKMGGCGIRVPVPDGSLTDITCIVRNPMSISGINQLFRDAAQSGLKGILEYTEDPIVSRDILGNPHSCIVDGQLTSVIGAMVKVVGWYDNESGYSNRLADTIQRITPVG